MKKVFPYILIVLILANLFAPLSVGTDLKIPVKIQKAEAADPTLGINITPSADGTSAVVSGNFVIDNPSIFNLTYRMAYYLGDNPNNLSTVTGWLGESTTYMGTETVNSGKIEKYKYEYTFTGLTKGKKYYAQAGMRGFTFSFISPATDVLSEIVSFTAGGGTITQAGYDPTPLPACGIGGSGGFLGTGIASGTITGCAAQLIYYVLFIPTSYIFALTGQFFDFTFGYSVNADSYRSQFVVQGWGIVRDFVNMFFIFVLLYIAFATILDVKIGGHNAKQMIINVVIIGLLINFSLFATQIIIDTSNILARVFYNSDAIKITQKGANCTTDTSGSGCVDLGQGTSVGKNGEISLSAAIVNKVNPQNLIINSRNVNDIENKGGKDTADGGASFGAGAFILVTLLAIAVNIVGIIVFISVGMIFVARVIGLWLAMIFVPFAFFSYTVPAMQNFGMVGWKKWWPETLKLAFLAPVFIFFLYLIIQFLDTGLSLINVQGQTGVAFVIATIVPFAFIMILLMKAKSIASDMSGSLGKQITGGVATVGGLALGGAALGTAVLGRNIIGRTMAHSSKTEGAQKMVKYRQDLKDYKSGKTSVHPGAAPKLSLYERMGDNLNRKQEKVNEVDHARHEIDSVKEKAGLKGVNDYQLSGVDEKKMKETYSKEKKSEAETLIKKEGYIDPLTRTKILESEDQFKTKERNTAIAAAKNNPANLNSKTGELKDEVKQKIEYDINVKFNNALKTVTDKKLTNDFTHLRTDSKKQVSGYDRAFARSNKGSYDARNLSQGKQDKREGVFTRSGAALIAGIAMGVRTGLKSSGINHGSGQNDFLKDIGHTITEALKSIKINVKIEESHGKSSDDHGGGKGDHH
jgi:hypothetical protein